MSIPEGFGDRNTQQPLPLPRKGTKRERPEEEALPADTKAADVAQKKLSADPIESFNFLALGTDLRKMVTNKLDPRTQQNLRETATAMCKEVTETETGVKRGQNGVRPNTVHLTKKRGQASQKNGVKNGVTKRGQASQKTGSRKRGQASQYHSLPVCQL